MNSTLLPLNAMNTLLKQSGAPRVSHSAKMALREVLEERAQEIAARAVALAAHAGRRTVMVEDIKLAIQDLRKGD